MIKEAIGVGESIEDAKESAILKLGLNATDDYDIEVLETPKKKTLGLFGGSLAKVKVSIEVADPKPEAPKKEKKQPAKKEKAPKVAAPAPEKAAEKSMAYTPIAEAVSADKIDPNSQIGKSVAYITEVLAKLSVESVDIKVAEIEGGYLITLDGENLGSIIGHRGETLDALQYLASLKANEKGSYVRIALNIGNYREKREEALRSLARRMASQALRSGRNRRLEPMNPYERRIIHTEIQGIEGVVSNSVDEGINRRVVISPEKGGRSDFGGRNNRGRRGDRNRSSNTAAPATDRPAKKDAGDIPLYGKI
ncbi:MAG: KH domain-containing protein, partial [Clostridia bacterium]|nr:KH domain-containing protein [Clostridia bacterium]